MILKKLNDNLYVILADEKTLSNNGDWFLSYPDYNKTFYFSHYTPTTGFWSYKKEKEDVMCKGYVGWNQFEII